MSTTGKGAYTVLSTGEGTLRITEVHIPTVTMDGKPVVKKLYFKGDPLPPSYVRFGL